MFNIVVSNHNTFTTKSITAGVPQVSTLVPSLFSFYINNILKLADQWVVNATYVDDTVIAITSQSTWILVNTLQKHLDQLSGYFDKYGMKVNVDKHQVVFKTKSAIPQQLMFSN